MRPPFPAAAMSSTAPPPDSSLSPRARLVALSALEVAWVLKLPALLVPPLVLFAALGPWWNGVALLLLLLGFFCVLLHGRTTPEPDLPRLESAVEVTREDAPQLHALAQDVSRALRTRRIARLGVVLPTEIVVGPPAGIRRSQSLEIGFPLLVGLPEVELRALIAAAIARSKHLRRRHVRRAHARLRYLDLATTVWLGKRAPHHALTRRFYPWLFARYAAATAALDESSVAHADREVAALYGAGASASAELRASHVAQLVVHGFWPEVWADAALEPDPPSDVFTALCRYLAEELGDEFDPILEPDAVDGLASRMSADWLERAGEEWAVANAEAEDTRSRLSTLDDQPSLTIAEQIEHASLIEHFRSTSEAHDLYVEIAAADPNNTEANFHLARHLLAEGDDLGLHYLSLTMDSDEDAIEPGCDLAIAYLEARGRLPEAVVYHERLSAHLERIRSAVEERTSSSAEDLYLLPDPETAALVTGELRPLKHVQRAFLARKAITNLPDEWFPHVLMVVARPPRFAIVSSGYAGKIANEVARRIDGIGEIDVFATTTSALVDERIRRLPGALIVARDIDLRDSDVWPLLVGWFLVIAVVELTFGYAAVDTIMFMVVGAVIALVRYFALRRRQIRTR